MRAPLRSLANIFYSGVSGVTFENENVLMTGAGAGSIGAEVLQGLISGAARVVAPTSGFSYEVREYYQAMCSKFRSRGSQLVVVPFNQGMNFVLGWHLRLGVRYRKILYYPALLTGLNTQPSV